MIKQVTRASPQSQGARRATGEADRGKLLGLEALRFVAAFAVLIWHYQHFAMATTLSPAFVRSEQPFYAFLWPFYEHGAYGVDLFWCISGYIFFEKYGSLIPAGSVSGARFFLLRFSRLYPLHVGTLLLVGMLQWIFLSVSGHYFVYEFNDLFHLVLQLFMASNWGLQRGDSFNGPIWSISVEVLVYLLFYLTMRVGGARPWATLAVLGTAVAWRYAHPAAPLATCVALFFAGGIVAILTPALRHSSHQRIVSSIVCVSLIVEPIVAFRHGVNLSFGFLLTYLPLTVFLCSAELKTTPGVRALIEFAGNLTYASYLLHFPLQLALVLAFICCGIPVPLYSPWFVVSFIGLTFFLSALTYRYFELPAQQWIRRSGFSRR